jgi:hypothetical protein
MLSLKLTKEVIDMEDKSLKDLMPELGQVIAHDFARFSWRDYLVDYAKVLDKLLDVLMAPYPAEEEAVKVIRDYIDSRQKPYGQWKSPDWLAYMLGQIVEKAKKRQRRKRRVLTDDELPF